MEMLMKTRDPRRDEKTHTGQDKVSLYKWDNIRGHGELKSIHKDLLDVDHRYQRYLNNDKSLEIASKFSWIAFGSLVVARRKDGSLFVIDGQHRLGAARKRADVTHVPCIVYDAPEVTDEAGGFLDINTGRRLPSAFDQHRALVMRGDEAALLIEKLARDHGFDISNNSSPGKLRCLATCRRLIQSKREAFLAVFGLAAEVCRDHYLDERVIDPLVYLYGKTNGDISRGVWRKAVLALGYEDFRAATDRAAAFYQKGGAKVWAKGLAQALNKGRRINRIIVDDAVSGGE